MIDRCFCRGTFGSCCSGFGYCAHGADAYFVGLFCRLVAMVLCVVHLGALLHFSCAARLVGSYVHVSALVHLGALHPDGYLEKSRPVESTWRRSRGDVATMAAASKVLRLGRPPFFVCVSEANLQLKNLVVGLFTHTHTHSHL